jgi:hypothetical protein
MGMFASSLKKNFYKKNKCLLCNIKMINRIDVNLSKGGVKEKMCGRVENNKCIISPHHLTRKCQKMNQLSNS